MSSRVDPAFWRDKRVFVTGGSGFLGSYVVDRLKAVGAHTIAPAHDALELLDPGAVAAFLRDQRPDMVIHLAARVGGIGANLERPAEFFYKNLVMGVHLMHEAWQAGVAKFVAIGTICAYPKFTPAPFREADLWNGYPEETNAPYGLAKKMLLVQSQAYRQQYGFNSIFLLPVNLYGPRDNFDPSSSHVIPALIKKCLEARESGAPELVVWGDGSPTREFLYAEDAAEGILLASERYDGDEPINLGTGQEISIKALAETIARVCDYDGRLTWDHTKPNGQPRRLLDVSRARTLFGFEAGTDLATGLQRTVDWYLAQRPLAAGARQS